MFILTRTYDTRSLPLDMVYLDAATGTATVSDVTLSATNADDTLEVALPLTAMFHGAAFPLSGADYLTPVTGDLTVTIDATGLATGIHLYSLSSLTGRWQGFGRFAAALAGFGLGGRIHRKVSPLLYVSVYALTGGTPVSLPTVPTSAWH